MAAYRALLGVDPGNKAARTALAKLAQTIVELAPPDYVADHFDRYAPTFEEHLTTTLGYVAPQTIASLLPPGSGDVLDLGCGTGLVAAALAGRFTAIDGVDLSPRMIDLAKAKEVYRDLHVGEVGAYLSSTARHYDLITAADLFIYVGALEQTFEGAAKCLRPGGRLAFSTETDGAANYALQPTGRYTQSSAYVERLAAASGFRVETAAPGVLRHQAGEPVVGHFHILVKP